MAYKHTDETATSYMEKQVSKWNRYAQKDTIKMRTLWIYCEQDRSKMLLAGNSLKQIISILNFIISVKSIYKSTINCRLHLQVYNNLTCFHWEYLSNYLFPKYYFVMVITNNSLLDQYNNLYELLVKICLF